MPSEIFIILTAYNEAPRIEATLAALAAAFPGAPVWVADDGSTDATPLLRIDDGRLLNQLSVRVPGAGTRRKIRSIIPPGFARSDSYILPWPRPSARRVCALTTWSETWMFQISALSCA